LSVLTKVFIVLLVIMSLLLSAGLIVFVNRVEHYAATAKTERANYERERAKSSSAVAEAIATRAERDRAVQEANRRAEVLATAHEAAMNNVAGATALIATAQAEQRKAEVDRDAAMAALRASQETTKAQEDALLALRTQNDDIQKKYSESSVALADLNQRNDALRAQLQRLTEENKTLQARMDEGQAGGGAAIASNRQGGTATPAQPLKGVVRAKKTIGGVQYATISLGSQDNVTRGMQFRVLDNSQQTFLGYITIDQVETNEATGRLTGPANGVAAVQKDNPVITHYQ
jgi:hypothetical protein